MFHAGAIPPNTPNTLKAANPACVGFAAQPRFGGGLAPSVNVMERARGGGPGNNWNTLAKVEGPQCFGGCLELCFGSTFTVSSMGHSQMDSKLGHGDIASILGRVASFEAKRWGLSCDLQTLRQQHSVADMDTRDELSEQVSTTSKRLQHAQSAVQEAMEELRCEAADLDE